MLTPKGTVGRKQPPGAGIERTLTGTLGQLVDLENVGAIRHVQVVRLGGAEGQHGRLPGLLPDESMALLGQDTFAHGKSRFLRSLGPALLL